ncbi:MAG: 3'-5' exonuclease [Burkholderiales bacterium]
MLDEVQEAILNAVINDPGPHWIEGYAGTGKTIIVTLALAAVRKKHPKAKICFVTYTHSIKDLVASGLDGDADIFTVDAFVGGYVRYDWVFVDEVQDIKEADILKIQQRGRHVVWAGDPFQSLYHGRVDREDLPEVLGTTSWELVNIYRYPLKVFNIVSSIYDAEIARGAMVNVDDSVKVQLHRASSPAEEVRWVWDKAKTVSVVERPAAILFPTHDMAYDFASEVCSIEGVGAPPARIQKGRIVDYSDFNEHFKKRRIPLQFLGSNNGSLPESDTKRLCYLMTYKSAKGLDFNSVFVPNLNDRMSFEDGKPLSLSRDEWQRKFFFVALTRSRRDLFLSYHGNPHPYIDEMPKDDILISATPKPAPKRRF